MLDNQNSSEGSVGCQWGRCGSSARGWVCESCLVAVAGGEGSMWFQRVTGSRESGLPVRGSMVPSGGGWAGVRGRRGPRGARQLAAAGRGGGGATGGA